MRDYTPDDPRIAAQDDETGWTECELCNGYGQVLSAQDRTDLIFMKELLRSPNITTTYRLATQAEIGETEPSVECPDCHGKGSVAMEPHFRTVRPRPL